MGEYGRPGEPDELCAGAERRSAAGVRTDWTELLGETGGRDGAGGDEYGRRDGDPRWRRRREKLEMVLLGQPVSEKTRATVLEQFEDQTVQQQAAKDFPIGRTTASRWPGMNLAALNQQARVRWRGRR